MMPLRHSFRALLSALHQLKISNATNLSASKTGFCRLFNHYSRRSSYWSANGNSFQDSISSSKLKIISVGAGITVSAIISYDYYNNVSGNSILSTSMIHNDSISGKINNHRHNGSNLVARTIDEPETKEAKTFEMGLYLMSQKEKQEERDIEKERNTSKKRFFLVRWFHTIKYWGDDYVIEPLLTSFRFLELAVLFLPVILSYPILSIIGPKQKHLGSDRLGKIYWNKFLKFCIQKAGPCFIKLGQWAASRTDIFSNNLCNELSSLHSNSRPHSFRQTKKIVCKNFDVDNFDEVFDEFIKKPVGVGSIAQVHVGKLSASFLRKIDDELDEIEADRNQKLEEVENSQGIIQSKLQNSKKLINTLKEKFSLYKYYSPKPHQWVAVKVLHPKVEVRISRDLKIMRFFANVINYLPTMEWLSLPDEVEQFTIFMNLQLDLRIEGINLNKFAKNFEQKELKKKYDLINDTKMQIKFPKPYLKCSGRDVLVEEYMYAIPISVILDLTKVVKERINEESSERKDLIEEHNFMKLNKILSNEILDSFLQMLILDNFIHSDLHPGNIFVRYFKINKDDEEELVGSPEDNHKINLDMASTTTELLNIDRDSKNVGKTKSYEDLLASFSRLYDEGYRPEVCYLDTGLVTELNEHDRINFLELFKALSTFDGYKAGELMVQRSRDPESALDPEIFALKVQRLVDTVKDRAFTLGNISIGDLLDRMLSMVRQHHVRMEADFVNVVVAILLLEGIGRQLDPELDLFASAIPILRRVNVKDAKLLQGGISGINMTLFWVALEARQLIHATVQDIYKLVQLDQLSPNY